MATSPKNACRELVEAYIFLRNTENRLQAFSDQQTHQLPSDENGKLRLAASMGCSDTESFLTLLNKHRQIVHGHFQMLLETGETEEAPARMMKIPWKSSGRTSQVTGRQIKHCKRWDMSNRTKCCNC